MTKEKLTPSEVALRQQKMWAVVCGLSKLPNLHQPLFGKKGETEAGEYHERLDYIQEIVTEGYAEPGYTDPQVGIVTGNWNDEEPCILSEFVDPDHEDTEPGEIITPGRALELLGCELEWSDEWDSCHDCMKLVRSQPNSYGWKRAAWVSDDCEVFCHECVKADPSDYIESLVGVDNNGITIEDIDLEKYGFVKLQDNLENGWYGGQKADPKVVGKALRKQGIDRYVFVIDSVGQFDLSFSVWVDKEQLAATELDPEKGLSSSDTDAEEDPAHVMQTYLCDTFRAMAEVKPGDGPVIVRPDPEDPHKAKARRVSLEDFIAGKALDDE